VGRIGPETEPVCEAAGRRVTEFRGHGRTSTVGLRSNTEKERGEEKEVFTIFEKGFKENSNSHLAQSHKN
jgi:hypothetical protein